MEKWSEWAARVAPALALKGLRPIPMDKLGVVDRLYAEVNAWGYGWDSGLSLREASPGLLPDGRVALIAEAFGIVEAAS